MADLLRALQAALFTAATTICDSCGREFVSLAAMNTHRGRSTACQLTESEHFWYRVDRTPGLDACWPWLGGTGVGGYGRWHRNGAFEVAHRAAWRLTRGPIPDGLTIDHLCVNPPCCNPAHMEVVTRGENTRRSRRHGSNGHENGAAKLTADAVREIRAARAGGESSKDVAHRFGITAAHVNQLVARRRWMHLP